MQEHYTIFMGKLSCKTVKSESHPFLWMSKVTQFTVYTKNGHILKLPLPVSYFPRFNFPCEQALPKCLVNTL